MTTKMFQRLRTRVPLNLKRDGQIIKIPTGTRVIRVSDRNKAVRQKLEKHGRIMVQVVDETVSESLNGFKFDSTPKTFKGIRRGRPTGSGKKDAP